MTAMAKQRTTDLTDALLKRGRQAEATLTVATPDAPGSEMPMVLTLDQLRPNPDNPRTSRNPRFDDIKASIRARGLDTVPKVTIDPDNPGSYIFSDGGNTRYQALSELWDETHSEHFYRVHCLFKPWPGRIKCVIGHLAENELRGELSFIEKAIGIRNARKIIEDESGKAVSLRELATALTEQGYPVSYSSLSRMDSCVRHLYPHLPALLESGLGRPQINALLVLRSDAEKLWNHYSAEAKPDATFENVMAKVCPHFNSPESWSLEMFRDEFIGELVNALPHPSLNYDRWLIELDPSEQNRRQLFGEPEPVAPQLQQQNQQPEPEASPRKPAPVRKPTPPPTTPSVASGNTSEPNSTVATGNTSGAVSAVASGNTQSAAPDFWSIPTLQDDTDHLRNIAFRLAFELADSDSDGEAVIPDNGANSAGYRIDEELSASPVSCLLSSLTGGACDEDLPDLMRELLIGSSDAEPRFDDALTQTFMKLIRTLRRLRELQRQS
ncbi:ParB family protein [Pantoea sp. YR343]|uniref:ParB family protein n=1 Tax=Pantoea sp. YR343 TaxID=1144341 RepID=UPI000270FF32|nr:ParB family protein [Pantoea sp. YR343]KAJ9430814.1 ParB family protein [Pantoea sp. YR343]